MTTPSLTADPTPRWLRWLAVGCAAVLATNLAVGLAFSALTGQPEAARDALLPRQLHDLVHFHGSDSWGPMVTAMEAHVRDPAGSLYALPKQRDLKFQYPPSSLFFLMPIPGVRALAERCAQATSEYCVMDAVGPGQPVLKRLEWLLNLSALFMVLASVALALRQLSPGVRPTAAQQAAAYGLGLLLAFSYYPLLKGVALGQIQVVLGLLLSLALLAYAAGHIAIAGALAGACVLAKPQYAVLLLWGLLRRDLRFTMGFVAVTGAGTALALAVFGIHNHLEYFELLRAIGRVGEAYWPNQSANGIANRLLRTDSVVVFNWAGFPTYSPVVHAVTLATTALILLAVLWPVRPSQPAGRRNTAGLAVAIMGCTMASPIAWEHHYGVFFACFAALAPLAIRRQPFGRMTGPTVLLAYLLMAVELVSPGFFHREGEPLRGLFGSHLYAGALLLLATGLRLRSQHTDLGADSRTPVPTGASVDANVVKA